MSKPKHIAVLSTPRVGNTWVSFSLGSIFGLERISAHKPSDLSYFSLEQPNVLQLHDLPSNKELTALLIKYDYRIVTVARHPLDVLISILHFVHVRTDPYQWLYGQAHIEQLSGLDPASPKFIEWCLSDNAAKLLEVTYDWSREKGAVTVKYEDLVADPLEGFRVLVDSINPKVSDKAIQEAVGTYDMNFFKHKADKHSWKGKANNWTKYFTQSDAQKIYERHKKVFLAFDYDVSIAKNTKRSENLKDWKTENSLSPEQYAFKAATDLETKITKQYAIVKNINQALESIKKELSLLEKSNVLMDTELQRFKSIKYSTRHVFILLWLRLKNGKK